jgi:NAD(P)-dependent dehydrogenase (short-subunit alcohol dehydrogenase family)
MVHIAPERFTAVLRTNILGTYYGSWVALRYFLAEHERTSSGGGKLINVLGRGDRNPVPMQSAYASSKAWVRSFTLALAKEYQDSDVGVYALNPGMMTTEMLTRVEAVEGYASDLGALETITRMWAKPPEIPARKAVWLASAATDGRTGLLVREATVWFMLWGALREGLRRLLGRGKASSPEVDVETVPSTFSSS